MNLLERRLPAPCVRIVTSGDLTDNWSMLLVLQVVNGVVDTNRPLAYAALEGQNVDMTLCWGGGRVASTARLPTPGLATHTPFPTQTAPPSYTRSATPVESASPSPQTIFTTAPASGPFP